MNTADNDVPLVSVITIFLNGERFLREAIESVCRQTYPYWELLLVDDGSTDDSSRIARDYEANYPDHIRYLEHQGHANRGMSASRNVGINNARGALVAFLDADDVWLPEKLEKQVALMAAQREAAALSGPTRYWRSWTGKAEDVNRDSIRMVAEPADMLYRPRELLRRFLQNRALTPATCSVMIRREAFGRTGLFEEQFRGLYEDQAFFLKAYLKLPIYLTSSCTDLYRQHAGSHVADAWRTGLYDDNRPSPSLLDLLLWLARYLVRERTTDLIVWTRLFKKLLHISWHQSMTALRQPAKLDPNERRPGLAGGRADSTAQDVPTVTALMAVFNGEKYLREAIESILAQTFRNFELLIVNDGSTDWSGRIVQSYQDPRVRLIENEKNIGLSRSLNRGIAQARGRYIARMDADDVSEPDRMARQVDFMDRHPDVVLVGSWHSFIDENGRQIGQRLVPCDDVVIRWMLQFGNPFAHSAVMIRKAVLADGAYNESLVYSMDYDLWVRLAERGRLANLNEFLTHYRITPESMTSRLGTKTEWFEGVVAQLGERLHWPPENARENERKGNVLYAIVSGDTCDASVEEAEWAIEALLELYDDFGRRHHLDHAARRVLRAALRRDTARALYWMGHGYPDRQDYSYARGMLWVAGRLYPWSLLTRDGLTLALKVIGGRPMVSTVRRLTKRRAPSN